jgi:hypothetical protein
MSKRRRKTTCFKCQRSDGIVRRGRRSNGSQWGLCHRCLADWYTEIVLVDRRMTSEIKARVEREP